MPLFVPKKINTTTTFGPRLSQARLKKGLSIEIVSKKINIRTEYLKALENENLDKLPAGLYGKKFLKEYARFLNVNLGDVLDKWNEDVTYNLSENPFSRKILNRWQLIALPRLIRGFLIIVLVAACFLYLILYSKKIISPPKLLVYQPASNISINSTSILIAGETDIEAEVRINGEIVLNNNQGKFSQTINLRKGLNNVIIKSKKKYSQDQTISRQILVE